MKLLFLLMFLATPSCNFAVKTFEFTGNHLESTSTFSSAILANKPIIKLPELFIICSSHYQTHMDTKNTHTIYVIYQNENLTIPWLSIGIWSERKLWVNVMHDTWYLLGNLQSQDLFEWIHICLEIDLVKKTILTSINGKDFGMTNVLDMNPAVISGFHIRLGIVHHSVRAEQEQFHGNIANIQLLLPVDGELSNLTKSLCIKRANTSIISWSDMKWTFSGKNFKVLEKDSSLICPTSQYADLRVPFKWTNKRGVDMCSKLGDGKITSLNNTSISSSGKSLDLKYGVFDKECERFLTPYIYSEIEGIVRNENTGEEENLKWIPGFPVNRSGWSNVLFYREQRNFENHVNHRELCLVCNTSLKTIYTMRGNCKYSLLGNLKYSAYMNDKYLGFLGDDVSIW